MRKSDASFRFRGLIHWDPWMWSDRMYMHCVMIGQNLYLLCCEKNCFHTLLVLGRLHRVLRVCLWPNCGRDAGCEVATSVEHQPSTCVHLAATWLNCTSLPPLFHILPASALSQTLWQSTTTCWHFRNQQVRVFISFFVDLRISDHAIRKRVEFVKLKHWADSSG